MRRINENKNVNTRKNRKMEVRKLKKYKKIAYIFLIIVIAGLSVILYANVSKGNENNQKEKTLSEVEFLETKLVNLLNGMNNVEARNYNISVSEITEQAKSQNESSNNSSKQQNSQGSGNSTSDGNSSSGDSSGSSNPSSDGNNQKNQKFNLESNGVLTNSDEINWSNVKSEIEILYSSIPTITLDLYQMNISQEDILGFNKEFDNLTLVAKEEKKEETLKELAVLYEYIPKFIQNSTEDEINKIVIETKSYLFKAYSKLDSKNWNEISNDTKQAIDSYSKLLTNTNIDVSKQYSISKVYVMINELQNAVELQDESVFLIKYKNILEEINSIV